MTKKRACIRDSVPDDPRDAYGGFVPKRLEHIFRGRYRLWNWCERLDIVQAELMQMLPEPFTADLSEEDVLEIRRLLQAARTKVMHASPFMPCDCPASELDCPKCNGKRWISAIKYLPEYAQDVA